MKALSELFWCMSCCKNDIHSVCKSSLEMQDVDHRRVPPILRPQRQPKLRLVFEGGRGGRHGGGRGPGRAGKEKRRWPNSPTEYFCPPTISLFRTTVSLLLQVALLGIVFWRIVRRHPRQTFAATKTMANTDKLPGWDERWSSDQSKAILQKVKYVVLLVCL